MITTTEDGTSRSVARRRLVPTVILPSDRSRRRRIAPVGRREARPPSWDGRPIRRADPVPAPADLAAPAGLSGPTGSGADGLVGRDRSGRSQDGWARRTDGRSETVAAPTGASPRKNRADCPAVRLIEGSRRRVSGGLSGGPRGVVACSFVGIPLRRRSGYNASGVRTDGNLPPLAAANRVFVGRGSGGFTHPTGPAMTYPEARTAHGTCRLVLETHPPWGVRRFPTGDETSARVGSPRRLRGSVGWARPRGGRHPVVAGRYSVAGRDRVRDEWASGPDWPASATDGHRFRFSRTFDEGGSMPRRMARNSSQLGAQGEMGTPGSSKVRENPPYALSTKRHGGRLPNISPIPGLWMPSFHRD
jgi:hypothetical protein